MLSCQLSWPHHLVSWLLVNLPHLSSLVTLLICSLYNLLVFAVLCQFVIKCFPLLSCLVLSCLVVSCRVVSCRALPCQALPAVLFFPYGVVFVAVFFFFFLNKAHSPAQLSLRLIPSSPTLTENILQNIYFCVPQKKETHTSKNDESLFCVNYLFKSRKKVKYILLLLTSLHGYYTLTAHEPWRYEKSL